MANEMTVQKTESLSNSEAFTNKVLKEFGSNVAGNIQVTDYQRQLIQGYFIATDRALKMAEEKRVSKNENNKDHKWDNLDPINWNTVDLNALALDVVHYARMGLDMMQDNHLSAIPFKDNNRLSICKLPVLFRENRSRMVRKSRGLEEQRLLRGAA